MLNQLKLAYGDTFGPKRIWSQGIWSPTIGPQLIGPSGQTVLNQFSPHGQMVPPKFGPPGQMVPRIFRLSRVTDIGGFHLHSR